MSQTIACELVVRASPERAFAAFTEVREVLKWLADGAVIGQREGGRWGLGWYSDPEGTSGYNIVGVFGEFEPPLGFVVRDLTFTTPEDEELGPMTLTIGFEAVSPEETRIAVVQQGVGEEPAWDAYRAGLGISWARSLEDLRAWLEEGRPLPGR
ncbi:MAG: SRPBCC domain-containing protein [Acidobacteria bacterium]|nr:SRPBCC domain-containing protein [Acidobacteriota bacterium]